MRVKLGDLLEEYSERNIDNAYRPVAVGKYGIRSREGIYSKELAKDYSKNKLIHKGTLTVGMGSKQIDIGILDKDATYSVSPAYHTYKIKIKNYKYLDYLMRANNFRMFSQYAKRGSRQGKSLDLKRWLSDELDVHSATEQDKIVNMLRRVETIIETKEKALENCDKLVKARFVEMFKDKDFPIRTLSDLSIGKGDYGAQSASMKYIPNRPRYIRITDINEDGTLNNDMVCSSNLNDDKQYRLEYGDFLFARMGATVGKTYAYTSDDQIFAGYLIRYKLNLNLINPRYLFWFTKSENYTEWTKINKSGAAQPGINAKKYNSLPISLPPIELQNEFADFVKQVDKSKFVLSNKLAVRNFHVCLIDDCVVHRSVDL